MSEREKEPELPSKAESEETASPKNQIVALLTLLPVLGILWLTMQYLPKFGDWMGAKADSVVKSVSGDTDSDSSGEAPAVSDDPGELEDPGPSSEVVPVAPGRDSLSARGPVSSADTARAEFISQIVEQLGGEGKVEVRHLAVSDDGERIVAALKLFEGTEGGRLVEVFFERDEFGRFHSSEDSPVSEKLVLWSE